MRDHAREQFTTDCESETQMSTETHPTTQRHHTVAPETPTAGPVTRIIAGSLATGAAAAMALTLGVFAGGTESVITGSALTGFGLGWALLAVLTTRYTNRPQGWAAVPAAAMGATGLALVAFAPDNDALTALNWVWPPVMLAMAVWMFLQVRRSAPRAGRWLLTPVVVVLALACVGGAYANITAATGYDSYAAPGSTFDVGDHRLHLDCRGHGGPTVVLFNGLGEISASWARITGPVAETGRVCAYDRAGQGWSDDVETPQDGVTAAQDLHALLAAAGESGPYVLVGHSTGGTYALNYAARYPDQVAGMVLLDSSSPEQLTRMPAYAGQYALMRRGSALMPTLTRLGLGSLLAPASHLPGPAADQVEAMSSTVRANRNARDELSVVLDVFSQAQALTTLEDRPLAVLTTSESREETNGWVGAQAQLSRLSTNREHRTVDSTHQGLVEDERPAAESVRAITDVVDAVRTRTPLDAN
jgi:pimeloyl-ACP methyl ester carboxylesterase